MHQALLRPLEAEPRPVGERLPAPPRREWLELARHWQSGAGGPVWFLADPRRTDLALVDPQARRDVERFDWGLPSMSMLGGMRPADVQWYRLGEPGWFATEGWSLTPETAGMARLMGQWAAPGADSRLRAAAGRGRARCSSAAGTWAPMAIRR